MRVSLCLCLVLVQFFATAVAPAEEQKTPTPKAQAMANVGKLLTTDISNYAKEGDADFSKLIENHKLNEVDWDALSKNEDKEANFLQGIVLDILWMRDRNEHAQAIIKKYNIKQNAPGEKK